MIQRYNSVRIFLLIIMGIKSKYVSINTLFALYLPYSHMKSNISSKTTFLTFFVPFIVLLCTMYFYIVTPVWSKPRTYSFSVSPERLKEHVEFLAHIQPPRNAANPKSLKKATTYIQNLGEKRFCCRWYNLSQCHR